MDFEKWQGSGNDFVLIDDTRTDRPSIAAENRCEFVRSICDRHYGVGADGVLFVERTGTDPVPTDGLRFAFFNPDGSVAQMCGNGMRCFGRYVYDHYSSRPPSLSLTIATAIGPVAVAVDAAADGAGPGLVHVRFGVPTVHFVRRRMTDGLEVTSLSTGNPHAVAFVADVDCVDVQRVGSRIRNDKETFPEGTNVHFVEACASRNEFRIRTYERGVEAETLACGTGICASAFAAVWCVGAADADAAVTFHARGGDVSVRIVCDGGRPTHLVMSGTAEKVFDGRWPLKNQQWSRR